MGTVMKNLLWGIHLFVITCQVVYGNDRCCQQRIVQGFGHLDGFYDLHEVRPQQGDSPCEDECIYKRDKQPDEEYCFTVGDVEQSSKVYCKESSTATPESSMSEVTGIGSNAPDYKPEYFGELQGLRFSVLQEIKDLENLGTALRGLNSSLQVIVGQRKLKRKFSKCNQLLDIFETISDNMFGIDRAIFVCLQQESENISCNETEKEELRNFIKSIEIALEESRNMLSYKQQELNKV